MAERERKNMQKADTTEREKGRTAGREERKVIRSLESWQIGRGSLDYQTVGK